MTNIKFLSDAEAKKAAKAGDSTSQSDNKTGLIVASGWPTKTGKGVRLVFRDEVTLPDGKTKKTLSGGVVFHKNDTLIVSEVREEKRRSDRSPTHIGTIFVDLDEK